MAAPTFDGRWKKLHKDVVDALSEPSESDLRMVDRLVQNLRAADDAMALAEETPFVEGSTGQITEHPGFKVAARCDGQAISLARQLRLTPFVRSNATSDDQPTELETDDPILQARDELAARRVAAAA
jgi:hypothetical protein